MFAKIKKDLKEYLFENKEDTGQKISDLMFGYN